MAVMLMVNTKCGCKSVPSKVKPKLTTFSICSCFGKRVAAHRWDENPGLRPRVGSGSQNRLFCGNPLARPVA